MPKQKAQGRKEGEAGKASRTSWATLRTCTWILKEVGVMNTFGRGNCYRETDREETELRESQSHLK